MKFVCDRCQTRYSIADEKIRQRIVRIRCKNCGNVITLHAGEVISGPQDATARLSSDLPAAPAEARASSRVSRPPAARSEWFVAVDGVEKGPLSCSEAAKFIAPFGPDHVVHVWKEGMDEWKRPKDVAIIAQELSALKRSPGEAPAGEFGAASSDATVVTPPPMALLASSRPAPPKGSGSGPKLPVPSTKDPPSGAAKAAPVTSGSAPKLAPGVTGSGPKPARPAVPGSGPKAAPPVQGSGPKAPPPIPATHRAPPPIPGSKSRPTPIAAINVVPAVKPTAAAPRPTPVVAVPAVADRKGTAKGAEPVVKTPASVTAPRPTPIAAIKLVTEARPAAKSAPQPVVKTPPPVAVHPPKAGDKAGHEAAPAPGPGDHTPGTQAEFDDDVPTSPDGRRQAARAAKDAPAPESTPVLESTPGANDFSHSEKTPPPVQPLPPVGAAVNPVRQSKNWQVANLSFAHPPVMPEGMSADGAMALPTPAPMTGPLFGNVADLPVKSLVGHAEVGLSRLTGLAGLVQKHHHLKYVAAAGVLVVLIIVVILLSWQGEGGKAVSQVTEVEKKARAAALAAEPVPVPAQLPTLAPANPEPEAEPSKTHAPAHASKRTVPRPAAAPSEKPTAPSEDPFAPPAGMTRSEEKPIPLAAIQGKRASAAGEPRVIPQQQIAEVVRRKENQAALKTCYERALKRDGRLRTGRLDITVSIGPMGTVQRVQVHGSADFMVIDKCLKEAIRHWRFPGNSEEYATSFPLILQGG